MKKNYPEMLLGIFALVLIILINITIASRYFFQISIVWTDEILKMFFLWSVFLGTALASKDDDLIGLTILRDKIELSKYWRVYGIFYYSTILLFSLFFTYEVYQILCGQIQYSEVTTVLEFPAFIISLGILGGSVLWVFYSICSIYRIVSK